MEHLRYVHVEIWWGNASAGKTYTVYSMFGDSNIYMKKPCGGRWFDGYTGQPVLLLDDFDSDHANIQEVISWCDRHTNRLSVRGGSVPSQWTTVIFTSTTDPKDWWPNESENKREEFFDLVCGLIVHFE
jgi:hypothetical protein